MYILLKSRNAGMEEIEKVKRLDRCESGFKYTAPLIDAECR